MSKPNAVTYRHSDAVVRYVPKPDTVKDAWRTECDDALPANIGATVGVHCAGSSTRTTNLTGNLFSIEFYGTQNLFSAPDTAKTVTSPDGEHSRAVHH